MKDSHNTRPWDRDPPNAPAIDPEQFDRFGKVLVAGLALSGLICAGIVAMSYFGL